MVQHRWLDSCEPCLISVRSGRFCSREDGGLLLVGTQLEWDLLQLLQHRQPLRLGARHQCPLVLRLCAQQKKVSVL